MGGDVRSWKRNIDQVVDRLKARNIITWVIYPFREYAQMRQQDGVHINARAHSLVAKRLADRIERTFSRASMAGH